MIDQWWRPDFDRDPAFEDLTDTQRVVVLAQTLAKRDRYDRVANLVLIAWLLVTALAVVAFVLVSPPPRGSWGLCGLFLLIPVYMKAWRRNAIRRIRRRACIDVAREESRAAIDAVFDRRVKHDRA